MIIDLTRGIIASKMLPEGMIFESFVHADGSTQTVIFINGLPLPYETFCLLMCYRIAPRSTRIVISKLGTPQTNAGQLPPEHEHKLIRLWKGVKLDTDHQARVDYGFGHAAFKAVDMLFDLILEGKDTKEAYTYFGEIMDQADEGYQSSLIDPTPVSLGIESFDLDDNTLITHKLRNKCLQRLDDAAVDESF